MSYKQQAMPIMVNNYSRLFGVKVRGCGFLKNLLSYREYAKIIACVINNVSP